MKRKDISYAVLAVAIIAVAGYLAMTQLLPKKDAGTAASSGTEVDVIGAIQPQLNSTELAVLQDPTQTVDYTVVIDLSTGLGNQKLFGQ